MASATPVVEGNKDRVKQGPIVLENTFKRDYLIKIEKTLQKRWQDDKLFEIDAPTAEELGKGDLSPQQIQDECPKWMGTFPYPYMNGSLHLGHAFTVSKIEFAAGYQRMKGKRALFPMGFHCTGMPIKSAADKLIREIEMFGEDFSRYDPDAPVAAVAAPPPKAADALKDPSKATKGKLAGKATGLTYQFQIMESIGVPRDEIKKFRDPLHWLDYFPPIAKADCNDLGARIDWRRSFITTDINPFYDTFVRWQMNKLHQQQKIKFGRRNTIYSPKDGQPCMDHDRSSGEAVGPQEYTGLKMAIVDWSDAAKGIVGAIPALEGKNVSLVAATLRPETMYGQTNCFVGTTLTYGFYQASPTDVYVVSERSAKNMSFQGLFENEGKLVKLGEIKGVDVVGTKIKAPFSIYPEVWVLPMDGVLATKGTGVVTSVPSDSPDDYATLLDLRKKPEYYKILPEWVAFDPVPIVSTPNWGEMIAPAVYAKLKIQSQKDVKGLAEAKEIAYKEGHFQGTMTVGEFKGESVVVAKVKARDALIAQGHAFKYAEPESLVMSRSGEECVVALVDQWYIDYGEEQWKKTAETLLARMDTYFPETRNGFEAVLNWLKQWACSRSFGLGSKIPWDQQFLVESLSDSTIYMSYYTVAHLLQGGEITGAKGGPLGIKAEEMTDEVWEYVLGSGAFPASASAQQDKFDRLKREFQYFYPMDVRSSGKDLIPNHLTFCIYVHAALFPGHHWPKSMRANGHLMLNGKKMAKSTGNSLTLRDAIEKFGADATRLSLADAGDGIEDANFEELTANSAIQRLHTQLAWIDETMANKASLRTGPVDSFWDRAFQEEMNDITERTKNAYEKTWYKEALQYGYYELDSARKAYQDATADIGGMHVELLETCLRLTSLLVAPIIPHFSDHIWTTVLQSPTSVQVALWPKLPSPDRLVLTTLAYVRTTIKDVRDHQIALEKRRQKAAKSAGKGGPTVGIWEVPDSKKPMKARLYVAKEWPAWQNQVADAVEQSFADGKVDDAKVREALTKAGLMKNKRVMPYVMGLKRQIADIGPESAFNRKLPFDELATLQLLATFLTKNLGLVSVELATVEDALAHIESSGEDGKDGWVKSHAEDAQPGQPSVTFWNVDA